MGAKSFFGLSNRPAATGWRRSAKVNCAVLLISSVALTVLVIVVLAPGSLKPVFFYAAECDSGEVAAVNLALHLLINIASTLVVSKYISRLASSNFFMQVLNAPTREEVDNAHFKSSWLGIGVPSVRNAFRVSPFKTRCWIALLLSSIPIHLLFNSAVFEVDKRESDFHLTIATEEFLDGGDFYPPGSSLAIPGLVSVDDSTIINYDTSFYRSLPYSPWYTYDYGYPVNKTDYKNHSSPVFSNISSIAKLAAGWERLEIAECKAEYVACHGLKRRRSVVLVVDNPGGWVWNDIWQLNQTEAKFWDQYVPSATPNHLFFDSQCAMVAVQTHAGPSDPNSNWTASPYHPMTSGLKPDSFNLTINYCLAEPLENICQIALSPTLLLGVALCVIAKTITAIIVTVVLNRPEHEPLVTLGDAVASFIKHPDPVTAGLCTVDQKQFRTAMRWTDAYLIPGPRRWTAPQHTWAAAIPVSVWLISYALFATGITTCAVLLYEGLSTDNRRLGSFSANDSNPFIPLSLSLVNSILLSNSPQLLLSFCYLAYNNLFTRLQMAKEWARFNEGYNSLRVTEPRGQQYSTYRLQLPYKYSIPLIVTSAFLHWLLSNTIYVFVSTGGYFGTVSFNELYGNGGDPSLPINTAVAVGYSLTSLVVMIVVSSVLITIPPILAFKRLPSNITQPGSNSLAISAACHSSIISRVSRKSVTMEDSSSVRLENMPSSYAPVRTRSSADLDIDSSSQPSPRKDRLWRPGSHSTLRSWFSENRIVGKEFEDEDEEDEGNVQSKFRRLAQSRLRWGVISMPAEWYDEYDHDGPVEHLGFGVEEDEPKDPVPGHMYA
ncbi:hypothetical protein GGS24DRAFT_515444 [Hypoxylon argillaceum]|nr:hypothetical protein GGS24DRAFT_515444 [Hypoxylon argillaceum]